MKKLYVGNLCKDTTEQTIKDEFGNHGGVQRVHIVRAPLNGQSWGYGFVEMDSVEDATNALDAMDGVDIDGSTVKVEKAKSGASSMNRSSGHRPSGRR